MGKITQKKIRRPLTVTALMIVVVTLPVYADDVVDTWSQGQQAFQQQDYLLALSHFESARKLGQSGPAVHYNIGVCHYKLRNYNDAKRSFERLNNDYPKMQPLAQYNLALVALKQSKREVAIHHFRDSYYLSTNEPKLRALSSTMLRRIVGEIVPASNWFRSFSLRTGFDDNVSLQEESALASSISAGSSFVELSGSFRGPFTGRSGFRIDGGVFFLGYTETDEFSQTAIQLGGIYDWRGNDWDMQLGAHAATTTLGGDGFDRSTRLSARVTRNLTAASSLTIRYRYDDIDAVDTLFNGVEGSRQRIDARYRWYFDGRSLSLSFTHEINDRLDPGVSPDRNKVRIDYRYAPGIGWGFEIGAERRTSEYGGIFPVRDEDLTKLNLGLSKSLATGWQILAQYALANNDSSDLAFSYARNQFAIGVLKLF